MKNQPNSEHNVNTDKSKSTNPLKNSPFFAIPRHIALLPEVTDRLFRLMAILCSAYGDDGHIEFKIKTLAQLLQKGDRQTRELIKEAERKKLIRTEETGRSLMFFLSDIFFESSPKEVGGKPSKIVQKPAEQVGGNPPISYKEQKKARKKIASPPPDPPKKPPIPDKMKASLSGSGIYPSQVYKSIEQFGDEYTMAAIEIAKTGERSIPGYFRFLTAERRDSVTNYIMTARKEAEKLDKDRKQLRDALAQQDEAKRMSEMTVTDFAEGARMMREALRGKR